MRTLDALQLADLFGTFHAVLPSQRYIEVTANTMASFLAKPGRPSRDPRNDEALRLVCTFRSFFSYFSSLARLASYLALTLQL